MKKIAAPLDMLNGSKFKTNKHGYVSVVEYYNCHTVIVAFENTGNIRAISAAKLRNGNVPDRDIPPESVLVGERVKSLKHGWLTITKVESENIVLMVNDQNEEIQMLLPAVQKMKNKLNEMEAIKSDPNKPISLKDLTKRNKKINSIVKKMLTDYGS
ncbi:MULTISPECIES: hypothetical protein [Psychromonas]|uniref:hypothetical protein n=1 Tax=Psychromonas TaxID=67572 RepID=UPI00042946BA|nr:MULTISPECIES: hypothetical protein [Psychromonas]